MAQIRALTPEGRLPSAAQAHVGEIVAPKADKTYVDATKLVNDTAVPVGQDWDTLPFGRLHKVTENLSAAAATAQHAPGQGRWMVLPMENLPGARMQVAWKWTVTPGQGDMMYRGYQAAGWGPWESLKGASVASVSALATRVQTLESAPAPASAPSSGFKTVGLPVTAGHSGSDAPLSGTYRVPLSWLSADVPVTRAKVRLRNINIRNGATRTGTISLDGIWLGTPDGNGHFAAAPQQIVGPVSFDGAAGYESPWFDVAGQTLTDKAISYAYTATSAPWAQLATAWRDPDQVGGATGNTGFSPIFTAAFTVDLIVETYATTPVIAVVGDSNSVGVGAKAVSEAWGVKLAHTLKAIPQLFGSSGDTMESSTDTTAFKWNRFTGHTPADATLLALGQNDASGTRTLAQIEAYAATVAPAAAKLGRRVYGVSMMPRTVDPVGDFEARRRIINTWWKEQRWGISGYIDTVPAMSADDETILPAFDSDGTHLNAAGFQAVADRIASTYRVTAPAPLYA